MNVIERNFFKLLRSGSFGDNEAVEPLSPWKWKRIYQLSLMHGVAPIVFDGISNHANDFMMQMPKALFDEWKQTTENIEASNLQTDKNISELFTILNQEQTRPILLKGQGLATLYPNPLHRTTGDIDIYFPYTPQAEKADLWTNSHGSDITQPDRYTLQYTWNGTKIEHHRTPIRFTNPILNRKLQSIIEGEIRCCDSAYVYIGDTRIEVMPPTLCLLLIIIRIAHYIISEGISLKQIIDLGMFLRKVGDKVDYVKFQEWIKSLGMEHIVRLESDIMVEICHFSEDEMPFVNNKTPHEDTGRIRQDIFRLASNHTDEWFFTQGRNIFVRTSNSGAMLWHVKHSAKYFRTFPGETVTNFLSSFAHSLSHIEE